MQRYSLNSRFIGYVLSNYAATAGGFFLNVALARNLGLSGRGSLAFALHASYLIGTFVAGGLERSLGPLLTRPTFTQALRLSARLTSKRLAIMAAAVLVIALTYTGLGSLEIAGLALAIGLAGLGLGALQCIKAASLGSGSSLWFAAGNVSLQSFWLCTTLVLGATLGPPWHYYLVAPLPVLLSLVLIVYRRRTASLEAWDLEGLRRSSLHYGVAVMGTRLAVRSDRLLLPILNSTQELGRYVVPAGAAELVAFGFATISEALIPRFTSLGNGLNIKRFLPLLVASTAAVSTLTTIFLTLLIGPVFGETYRPSGTLAALLGAGTGVLSASRLLGDLLAARNSSGIVSRAELSASVIAAVSYLIAIPTFGAEGAAGAALVAYTSSLMFQLAGLLKGSDRTIGPKAMTNQPKPGRT